MMTTREELTTKTKIEILKQGRKLPSDTVCGDGGGELDSSEEGGR
jgi:hypothetical protein